MEDVKSIAITDYFSLEGYEIVQYLRNQDYLDNFELVLPNIEFRLGTITGEDNRLNLHVIFSEEVGVEQIRQEFLTNLEIRLDGGDKRSLRPRNLEEFGAQAKRYHEDAEGLSDYVAGCKYAWVEFDDIVTQLESSPSIFEGKYLIVLSGAEWSEISWFGQDAEIRRQLLADSHALFSGRKNDRKWATGQGDLSEEEIREEFGSLIPVLHGSDAHNFDRLCKPDEQRKCWVKADYTFEGLKQVLFEPTERLKIGPKAPDGFTQIHTLDSIKIQDGNVNPDLEITDVEIPFNSNLVSVIGNQGAGKTALLDLIANCFTERTREQTDDENSFIGRIEDSSPNIKTEISFAGEDVDSFSKDILDSNTVNGPDISYIPQGKIVEYCEKGNELHERIRTLVTESVKKESTELATEIEDKKEEISEISQNLRSVNAELHEINPQQVKSDIDEETTDLEQVKAKLDNKEEEIEEFKEVHKEELEETEAEDLQSELDRLNEEHEFVSNFIDNIDSALSYLEDISELNDLIEEINEGKSRIDSDVSVNKVEINSQRNKLGEIRNDAEDRQEELSREMGDIRSELDTLDEVDEELSNLLDERRQLEEQKLDKEKKISNLREKIERVEKLNNKQNTLFVSYVSSFFDLKEIYENIAEEFSEKETRVLDEIDIEPRIELEESRTKEFVEILDNRSVNRSKVKSRIKKLDKIISGRKPEDLENQVEEYLSKMEEFREYLLDSRDPIEFDSLLYGDYLELTEGIYYQNTPTNQLSRGQKGTVLLRIYLAKGENPLIIDSPEENLDNQFVFEELIGAIRKAKKDRQIFLATHDANLVVNTDSEQIVIAEFDQGEMTFESGSLEDQYVRDKAKGILEGGDEAFRLREEKYDLNPK